MSKKIDHKRIELTPEQAEASPQIEADLSSRKISFMLPAEIEMVGGGAALQFAYDSPTMYV